ncbi:MAG: metallophosphoesterase [Candidatus Zixiibacteriota bacterium]
MAKILLASDIQLGRQFPGLGKSGDLVRKALKVSLEKCVALALESTVDLFVVSGNLFATNLVSRNLIEFVFKQADRLGRIPLVIVPGNLDCLDDNSIYRHMPIENRPDNLYVLGLDHECAINFADSDITVYGIPDFGAEESQNGWKVPARTNFDGSHLLIVGNTEAFDAVDDTQLSPIMQQLVLKDAFDFIAVGGTTEYKQWATNVYSSGSAEALDFDLADSGLCLMIDLDKSHVAAEPNPIGELNWKRLIIDTSKFRYNIEIERELQKLAGANTLLRVEISGAGTSDGFLDLSSLERSQANEFCHLQICDKRNLTAQGFSESQGEGSLIGEYTALLSDSIDKAPGELKSKYIEAMSTGRALLSGKDVI